MTLLLVTFTFLVLMMPSCAILIYVMVYDFTQSPQAFAGYYLFGNIAGQAYFTNSGINFFLYVISGRKFRSDLINLLLFNRKKQKHKSFFIRTKHHEYKHNLYGVLTFPHTPFEFCENIKTNGAHCNLTIYYLQ